LGFLTQFPEGKIIVFALVMIRVSAFIVAMPIIGQASVPAHLKILFSLVLSFLLFPLVSIANAEALKMSEQLVFFVFKEACVGLFIGFLSRMFFFAIQIGGEMIGVSSGLAAAQLFNPIMGNNGNVFEQFHMTLSTLFFLGIEGHHHLITAFAKSFKMIPISDAGFNVASYGDIALYGQDIFVLGLKLSAPVVVSILLANLAMGVLGRSVPQINVLVTSMQVTLVITIVVLIVSMPLYVEEMQGLLSVMMEKLFIAMKAI
jgi:flagellar biosynthetic protein FliR